MRCIYLARDAASAELVRIALMDAGIPAVVLGTALGSAVGDIPFTSAWPRVCVNETDAERGRRVVLDCGVEPPRRTCARCGYDLHGLPEPRCPECGEPFARPGRQPGPDWSCPTCGEALDGQFDACWKCGASRSG